MSVQLLVALLLAGAVLLGSIRSLWRLRTTDGAARPTPWRLTLLLLAQAAGALLLYCVLFPPPLQRAAGTLVVMTARAAQASAPTTNVPGRHVVVLPEARMATPASGEAAPDLATALRRHPATAALQVIGAGLEPRDRDAVRGLAVTFSPAPLPRGLVELQAPGHVPAGRRWQATGRGHGLAGGSVELLAPSGARVDRSALDADGHFTVSATTRDAGLADYRLRLLDRGGRVVDSRVLPLVVAPARRLRVLVLAGAPDPELKYLRRWARDAGLRLEARIELGAGMRIGDAPPGLDAKTLDALDLLVLDQRSWAALGAGQRAALHTAVDRGLGLLLRLPDPVTSSDRMRLRALGFDTAARPARAVRLGAGFARAGDAVDAMPTLSRSSARIDADDGIVLLADGAGEPLATWRARGRGRIGVATFGDSYRLALAGRRDVHGQLWSQAFETLARPAPAVRKAQVETAPPGTRGVVCNVAAGATVEGPGGDRVALHVGPATGAARCAGFWARQAGWHLLRNGKGPSLPFHVHDDRDSALQAQRLRDGTAALAGATGGAAARATVPVPGPRWPWFVAWLALASAAWWLERSRFGLRTATPAAS